MEYEAHIADPRKVFLISNTRCKVMAGNTGQGHTSNPIHRFTAIQRLLALLTTNEVYTGKIFLKNKSCVALLPHPKSLPSNENFLVLKKDYVFHKHLLQEGLCIQGGHLGFLLSVFPGSSREIT